MQTNGDLALYQINADSTSTRIWDTGTQYASGYDAALLSNGALVVYDKNNNTWWDSNTESMGTAPYTLTVYDFYIELTDKNGLKIWNNNVGILYKNIFTNAPSSITSPGYLYANKLQYLLSASKNTLLLMQNNGDLRLFQINVNGDGGASSLWDTGTQYASGYDAALLSNGALVVYDKNNNTWWDSNTESMGTAPYTLTVYDFYIELTDKNGLKIWNNNVGILYKNIFTNAPSSITSPGYLYANKLQYLLSASKNTLLLMQNNGDLRLFQINVNGDGGASSFWDTRTQYVPGYDAALLSNGALVVYDKNNNTWWNSNTESMGTAPYTLTVYDFYIELTDKNGIKIWNNNAGILYKNVYASAPSSIMSPSYLYANAQTALMSASKNTLLIMQYNKNLVLYQINADSTSTYLWGTGTQYDGGYDAALLSNGALVVYDKNNNTWWDSNTESMGTAPYTLTVYDSYIELTDKTGIKIWNNNAGILYKNVYASAPSSIMSPSYLYANAQTALMSASKNTLLIMQYNGDLVLYQINADLTSTQLWGANPNYNPGYEAALLSNGALVVYNNNNNTIWDSGTENKGTAPYTLTVYDYNIKLTDTKNTIIYTAP